MTEKEIKSVLDLHTKWLKGEDGGECANLRYANPQGADLRGANLRHADLQGAYLRGANLRHADLQGANLRGANLRGANLRGANLRDANLRDADLNNTKIDYNTAGMHLACPESGSFDAWKKCEDGVLVKVKIPADAKRSSATTLKCRAERVEVLEVIGAEVGIGLHDGTKYRQGAVVSCDRWDDDRWSECSRGIHFFMNRACAEVWQ